MRNAIIFIVLFIAVISFPQSREWLKPHVETALNPVYRWSTNSRLGEIHRRLEADQARRRGLPRDQEGLSMYLDRAFPGGNGHLDSWGTPYFLQRGSHQTIRIGSAGPDREVGTADDLLSQPLTERQ